MKLNSVENYNVPSGGISRIPAELENSVFVWLDILGFSDSIEDETNYLRFDRLLEKFSETFSSNELYECNPISDDILLNISKPNYPKIIDAFRKIGEIQLEFTVKNNEFIRGGIGVGSQLKKDSLISNGFARAVKMEGKNIDWPIIGTNSEGIKSLRKLVISTDLETFGLIRGFNQKGEDIYFIDFLDKTNAEYYDLLLAKLKESSKYPNIYAKYIWLLRYYHHKFGSQDEQIDRLKLRGVVL